MVPLQRKKNIQKLEKAVPERINRSEQLPY